MCLPKITINIFVCTLGCSNIEILKTGFQGHNEAKKPCYSTKCYTGHLKLTSSALLLVQHYYNITIKYIYINKNEKTHLKNEQRRRDASAKNEIIQVEYIGKSNNYYEDIYIPPNSNTH